jgi:amidase
MMGEALFQWSRGFVPRSQTSIGPLRGKSVAVKDLYDLAGLPTSYGCPAWFDAFPHPAESTSPPVHALLASGASFAGKAHLDELASSLQGENAHYGTPHNASAPGCVPGGSSSGSASAVASELADIGLGSDTAGSIRIPSSFCSLFGIRVTHGSVSLEHARALAPSFDAAGWVTRNARDLVAAGETIFNQQASSDPAFSTLLVAEDAFEVVDEQVKQALLPCVREISEQLHYTLRDVRVADETGGLSAWRDAFRKLQPYEVWQTLGWFVEQYKPPLGRAIQDRMDVARSASAEQAVEGAQARKAVTESLERQLGEQSAIIMPSAPGPPTECNAPRKEVAHFRGRELLLTAGAPLSGLPQVSIPLGRVSNGPVGLGIIGPRNSDLALMKLAEHISAKVALNDITR